MKFAILPRMNTKRLVLAIVAVFAAVFATDVLIHGFWLNATYKATMQLWRSEADMQSQMCWLIAGQFLTALMFVLIWSQAAVRSLPRACAYGLCMALFQQATTLITYAVQPIPGEIIFKWFISGIAQGVLMGVILHLIYKPRPAAADKRLM